MHVVAGRDLAGREPDHLAVSPHGISFGDRSDGEFVPGEIRAVVRITPPSWMSCVRAARAVFATAI